jgi:hypothetical protein
VAEADEAESTAVAGSLGRDHIARPPLRALCPVAFPLVDQSRVVRADDFLVAVCEQEEPVEEMVLESRSSESQR